METASGIYDDQYEQSAMASAVQPSYAPRVEWLAAGAPSEAQIRAWNECNALGLALVARVVWLVGIATAAMALASSLLVSLSPARNSEAPWALAVWSGSLGAGMAAGLFVPALLNFRKAKERAKEFGVSISLVRGLRPAWRERLDKLRGQFRIEDPPSNKLRRRIGAQRFKGLLVEFGHGVAALAVVWLYVTPQMRGPALGGDVPALLALCALNAYAAFATVLPVATSQFTATLESFEGDGARIEEARLVGP